MDKQKIKIIRKNDEYSAEYQIGDIFQVDSTWYGGANVTSVSGIPLSLDKDERRKCRLIITLMSAVLWTAFVKWWHPALKSWQ